VAETSYASCGDLNLAYQVFGDGPVELVFVGPMASRGSASSMSTRLVGLGVDGGREHSGETVSIVMETVKSAVAECVTAAWQRAGRDLDAVDASWRN
jgi:hypothetical protein